MRGLVKCVNKIESISGNDKMYNRPVIKCGKDQEQIVLCLKYALTSYTGAELDYSRVLVLINRIEGFKPLRNIMEGKIK